MAERVHVVGPASWNQIVRLDRLPDPVPHTVVASDVWHTVGGTSAGKALSLAGAGREVVLSTQLAAGSPGDLVGSALTRAGVDVRVEPAAVTEQHLNLMTAAGERLSVHLAHPPAGPDDPERDARMRELMAGSAVVVLDLGAEPRRLVPTALAAGRPIWTDLHDYDGSASFHQPFLEAAEAVFMNADATSDPLDLLARCLRYGAAFAVCTLGADGAVALDRSGRTHRVAAVPATVVDTNGAGDAFFAGTLDAHLAGADLPEALASGAQRAALVLGSRHLHPSLDPLLDPLLT